MEILAYLLVGAIVLLILGGWFWFCYHNPGLGLLAAILSLLSD